MIVQKRAMRIILYFSIVLFCLGFNKLHAWYIVPKFQLKNPHEVEKQNIFHLGCGLSTIWCRNPPSAHTYSEWLIATYIVFTWYKLNTQLAISVVCRTAWFAQYVHCCIVFTVLTKKMPDPASNTQHHLIELCR